MSNELKILFFSDCHLNNPKLDCERMVGRLLLILLTSINEHKPDVLLCGGDWFDRPTSFTSKSGTHILDAMSTIISVCAAKGIVLRMLKGTGSHDGVQNNNWGPLANRYKDLDFKLYNEVDIISEFGLNVLVIPDSTIPNPLKCEVAVRARLAELNLTSVDLAFTHLMYTHHVENAGYDVECSDSKYYNDIIDIVCLNGHIHKPSLYEVFLTGGSTDRLRQGENHPKGIHLVTINKKLKTFKALFIEQKDAAIFNSYDVVGDNPIDIVNSLRPKLDVLDHTDIYIRLHYEPSAPIRAVEKTLSEQYPNIKFDTVPNSKAAAKAKREIHIQITRELPERLSVDTLIPLVGDKCSRDNIKFTDDHIRVLEELRDECR